MTLKIHLYIPRKAEYQKEKEKKMKKKNKIIEKTLKIFQKKKGGRREREVKTKGCKENIQITTKM